MKKQQLAEKMLKEKRNYPTLEEAFELFKYDEKMTAVESYVYNSEEIETYQFDWTKECLDTIKKEIEEMYWENSEYITIWDGYDEFDEFTGELFPAPNYMELIK